VPPLVPLQATSVSHPWLGQLLSQPQLLQNPALVQLGSDGHIKHLPAESPSPLKHVLVGFAGMPFVRTTQVAVAATLEELRGADDETGVAADDELRADEEATVAADDELRTEDELRAEETPAATEELPPLALEGVAVLIELETGGGFELPVLLEFPGWLGSS
jgi:hypothetical protein